MKKQLVAAIVAAGCLLGLQASAFAQSFAFSGVESEELSSYYNRPVYWNYAPNALDSAPGRVVHHRAQH
jgi:hypothetical protein